MSRQTAALSIIRQASFLCATAFLASCSLSSAQTPPATSTPAHGSTQAADVVVSPTVPTIPIRTPTPSHNSSNPEDCEPGPQTGAWNLKYRVTGGFAGISRGVDLASDGEFAAFDEGSGAEVAGIVEADDLEAIGSLLAATCLPAVVGRPPACADCFDYAITIKWDVEAFVAVLNDVSLPGSSLAPLVEELTDLLNRKLGGP